MKNIFTVLRVDKFRFIISLLLTSIVAVGTVYTIYGRSDILNLILEKSNKVWIYIAILVGVLVSTEILTVAMKIVNAKLVRTWKLYLGGRISKKIENMNYKKFHEVDAGNHMTVYTYNLELISGYLLKPLLSFINSLVLFIASFIFLLLISWKLAIFAVVSTVLLFFISGHFSNKIAQGYGNLSSLTGAFSAKLKEYVMAYDTLKALSRLILFSKKIRESQEKKENQEYSIARFMAFAELTLQGVQKLFEILIFVYIIYLINMNEVAIGAIIAAPTILSIFLESCGNLVDLYIKVVGTKDILASILDTGKLEEDKFPDVKKEISFKNIGHSYGDKKILQNLNFSFNSGGKYALVGKSGSGKSTILKLLLGRLTLQEGIMEIDGQEYRPKKDINFSKQIGYMNQEVFLFSDSIRYNITLGEDYNDEEIWNVLKEVGLFDKIQSLPEKLDEFSGELGDKFSGGERQRIALARILIRKLPIVLLDEATSAVDVATSKAIEKALLTNPNITVIMITHHLQDELKPYLTEIISLT